VGHNTMGYIHIRSMSTYIHTHTHTEATTIAITFSDNITMLAACIAEGTKQRSAVCPSVCPISSNVNVDMINQHCPDAASLRFGPFARGPIHLYFDCPQQSREYSTSKSGNIIHTPSTVTKSTATQ